MYMCTIWRHTAKDNVDVNELGFTKYLMKICEEHHREGRALIFAILLYSFRHPQVIKVLKDMDYWQALDEAAGKSLTVFSFHGADSYGASSEIMNPDIRTCLLREFGIIEEPILPCVLFFQPQGDELIDYCLIDIKANKVEDAYLELRDVITTACKAIAKVTHENKGNRAEVFQLAKEAIELRKEFRVIKTLGKLIPFDALQKLAKAV